MEPKNKKKKENKGKRRCYPKRRVSKTENEIVCVNTQKQERYIKQKENGRSKERDSFATVVHQKYKKKSRSKQKGKQKKTKIE